jgi:hypothetical protein
MNNEQYDDIRLTIPPALLEKMDRALIAAEDARRVITRCEETGVKLRDDVTGELVGHLKAGMLTYWVRYTCDNGDYTLCNIYAHRAVLTEDIYE